MTRTVEELYDKMCNGDTMTDIEIDILLRKVNALLDAAKEFGNLTKFMVYELCQVKHKLEGWKTARKAKV
jgi:hypothetical protein